MTWQPGPASDEEETPAGRAERGDAGPATDPVVQAAEPGWQAAEPAAQPPEPASEASGYPQLPPAARRGRTWAAMVALLAIGLCGLAGGAAGAVRQLLPRQFSAAQQTQIQTWQMTRRWRAMPAGQIFPATVRYQVLPGSLDGSRGLWLTARRLGIAPQSSCGKAVSKAAAAVLAAGRCATVLRATYADASGSMVITVGVAALPTPAAAMTAFESLSGAVHNQSLALHAFPLAGSAAAGFRQAQRQLSIAVPSEGPYVVIATAGFSDGRRHVALATDDYLELEMNDLASGLADNVSGRLDAQPAAPTCPGAPGC